MHTSLTQSQREAIIDLLLYAMYEDRRVALQEDEFIDAHAATLGWQSPTAVVTYVKMATARVRSARATAEGKAHFLDQTTHQLDTDAARQTAIDLCHALLTADANESEAESVFEAELNELLQR
jgi:uncharacterized tellurite resistance protein B-like protein